MPTPANTATRPKQRPRRQPELLLGLRDPQHPLQQGVLLEATITRHGVVDPFVGGGQTAIAAYETQRRFLGGDINPRALRLTAARLSVEARPPAA